MPLPSRAAGGPFGSPSGHRGPEASSEAVLGGESNVLCLVLQLGSPQKEDRKGKRMKEGDRGGVQKIPRSS